MGLSSEYEVEHTTEATRVEIEEELVDNQFKAKNGGKASKQQSASLVKAEQEEIVHNWLTRQNDATKKQKDHCSTTTVAWCCKHEGAPPEIADWARRRFCGHASSATLERAFSKAGLIARKKRQPLLVVDMDGISLLGWHYKDNGWGGSAKRPRCVPQVEGERLGEESQMEAH